MTLHGTQDVYNEHQEAQPKRENTKNNFLS